MEKEVVNALDHLLNQVNVLETMLKTINNQTQVAITQLRLVREQALINVSANKD